jgi:FMN phosphatase YigB (HAD superfamily)
MVDDSSDNIKEAQALGMKTLLYPQPWNNSAVAVEALLDELSSLAVRS